MTKKVIVASQNPVKINTAKVGFSKMFPEIIFEVIGVSAPSGVPDQPTSEDETIRGATNRANNASKLSPDADFWVGIEGGIEDSNSDMFSFAWIVVKDKTGKLGRGRTGTFFLPQKVADVIRAGHELGEADDIVFGVKNSKQQNGAVGILTGDAITRTSLYEQAMIFALIPFKNEGLY